jgi:hypothetical protein
MECNSTQLEFHALGHRELMGHVEGGRISTEAGGLLLCEVGRCIGLLAQLNS